MKLCVRCGQNDAKVWLEGVGRVHRKCMTEAETARHSREQRRDTRRYRRLLTKVPLTAQGVSK